MGVFRSKGVQDEVKASTSGQPRDPEHRAVTEIVTTLTSGVTWRIDPVPPQDGTDSD
ncbi:hypothetical protein KV097_08395 [Mumia sp. zg.B17]|uniref:hypothetical protein n=1 Tax=Mumia sp. zg.B17 TaxID=2855446 RepID=UPI001C6F3C23|nr:hypothetical protein [Mumia sp. zg.B17]MBW9205965.1 hypothetical protein [Mumia sp. zg.B17]